MKKYALLIILILAGLTGCKKDKTSDKVNSDGLTEEIVNLVPESVLNEIESMGMPIYGGENPPDIENSYLASPFVLKATNIENDYSIGYVFADYYVKFYDQDNNNLSVSMDYINGPENGSGYGGYIVGSDNKFSAFFEVSAHLNGTDAKLVHIISGELETNGIKDLYFANFMLDNYGNTTGYWIENGDGRVIYDSDGFSPVTDSFKSIKMPGVKSVGAK